MSLSAPAKGPHLDLLRCRCEALGKATNRIAGPAQPFTQDSQAAFTGHLDGSIHRLGCVKVSWLLSNDWWVRFVLHPVSYHLGTFRTESVAVPTSSSSYLSGPHTVYLIHMRPAGKYPGRSPLLFLHVQMSMSVPRRMGAVARSATTSQEASNVPAIAASHLPQMAGIAKVSPWLSRSTSPTSLSWEGKEHPLEI